MRAGERRPSWDRVPRLAKGRGEGLSETFQIKVHASFLPPFPPQASCLAWFDKVVSLGVCVEIQRTFLGFGLYQALIWLRGPRVAYGEVPGSRKNANFGLGATGRGQGQEKGGQGLNERL